MKNVLYWLGEGEFTKRDDVVRGALEKASANQERETPWGKISLYLQRKLKSEKSNPETFRRRNASEIIKLGVLQGCTERGLVFCALAREYGIPTKFVDTLQAGQNLASEKIEGHVFVDMYIENIWQAYEPIHGFTRHTRSYTLRGKNFTVIGKGLDFSEIHLEGKSQTDRIDNLTKLFYHRTKLGGLL
jgi:hypothetical protein